MRPALLLPAVLLFALAACAAPTPPPASPSAPPATPAPTAEPSPSPVASPTSAPATDAPSPTAAPSDDQSAMTPQEAALIGQLRADAGVDCTPRRSDLPPDASYGIECRPDSPLVARVGIYAYPSANEAAHAYLDRLADAGVDVNSGDCGRDVAGETAWTPGDGEGSIDDPGVFNYENSVLSTERSGCFRDGNGTANVRITCGLVYIGVLGRGTDLSELTDWAWTYPEGYEVGTPDPPGLCIGPATQS